MACIKALWPWRGNYLESACAVSSGYNQASHKSPYGSPGAAMNATIQFTCPQCSHQMKLPSSTVGKQGKCPSCSTVITITASQPGANANEIQVAPKQPVAEPASPQAVQRIQQPALAAVAHSTPQPALKPRKSRWKIICVTHLLTAVLTIGLMPYWKPAAG